MSNLEIYTIGFTKKSAEEFFGLLRNSGAKRIVDVRLNNSSQLAGFAKSADLRYFARELCGMDYVHLPELAPDQPLFEAYKKHKGSWDVFEQGFLDLMRQRAVERAVPQDLIDGGCLLCSEATPDHCHRRLVIEYLEQHWDAGFSVTHL